MSMLRRVVTFGSGDCGRLGLGIPTVSVFYPRVVAGPWEGEASAVAAGGAHTLVCTADGSLFSFGLNDRGQLGHTPRAAEVPTAGEVLLPEPVAALAAGAFHSLVLTQDGRVWAWGDGTAGALGLGVDSPAVSAPRLVKQLQGHRIVGISAGQRHSMAVSASGEVFSWGTDSAGCLGHGPGSVGGVEPRPRLVRALAGQDMRGVAAGHVHSGAVSAGGEAFLWGDPDFVPGTSRAREAQVNMPRKISLRGVTTLACGGSLTLAIDASSQLFAWGQALPGRDAGSRGLAAPLPGIHAVHAATGWQHSALIDHKGHMMTWGWGGSQGSAYSWQSNEGADGGQLGLGPSCSDLDRPWPVEVIDSGGRMLRQGAWRALEVSCGMNHTVALVDMDRE